MQITNPLNTKIAVQIKGVVYEIEGGDTIYNIPEDIARDWQEKTHQFIILRKDKMEDKKVETVEIPTPKVEKVITPEELEVLVNDETVPIIKPVIESVTIVNKLTAKEKKELAKKK